VAGLLYLQHAFDLSDEAVVARWVENPYYQHFCGELFFQHRPPIDPSSLTRWRKRIGEEGVEWLLTKNEEDAERPQWGVSLTNEAGRASGTVADRSLERVSVDTTVMEKSIAHPTDARLYETARRKLVALAAEAGSSCARAMRAWRRGWRRRPADMPTPASSSGCAKRAADPEGLHRSRHARPATPPREHPAGAAARAHPRHSGADFAAASPATEGKGQALQPARAGGGLHLQGQGAGAAHEFGAKVSAAATNREGFIVGMRALPGNPYDGHLPRLGSRARRGADRLPSVPRRRRPRRPRLPRPSRPRAC
jgi:IS5 family transposase